MTHSVRLLLGVAALAALAGCAELADTQSASNPLFPDVGMSPDVSQKAVNACLGAVAAQTTGGVEVVGSEFSQANNVVYMVVGPQRAPWRCLVSNDGQVAEVMFVGSEGAA